MKTQFRQMLVSGMFVLTTVLLTCGDVAVLSDAESARWRRELLPLPQELVISAVRKLDPGNIGIRGRSGAAGLERLSVSNIVVLFKEKTGLAPQGQEFEILIGLMDENGKLENVEVPRGARLKETPNSDQAYVIQPVGDNMLVVAALTDKGLYYGTLTLRQWLERHLNAESAEIPLAKVVDWPDLEERGYWHMYPEHIPWLASMKMNRFYLKERFTVVSNEVILYSQLSPASEWSPPFEKARQYAAEVVRSATHFDYWAGDQAGYAKTYSHLLGKGESAKNQAAFEVGRIQQGPCASHPDFARILARIMTCHAAQGAAEEMVWMSEYPALQCECSDCMETGQYVAEVQAALTAWEETKLSYPDFKLSVFFGRGGYSSAQHPLPAHYPDNQIIKIMEMLPPNVTMRSSGGCDGKDGRLMDNFAKQGKRISRMNATFLDKDLPANFQSDDVRLRVEQFLTNKYIGAWTIAPGMCPNTDDFRRLFDYRMCAAAEYEWNSKGRTATEFAEAWAVKQGYADPELLKEWILIINSPVGKRMSLAWGMNIQRTWLSRLPEDMKTRDIAIGDVNTPEQNIIAAQRALAAAMTIGDQRLIQVSQILAAYCALESRMHDWLILRDAMQAGKPVNDRPSDSQLRELVAAALQEYIAARHMAIREQKLLPSRKQTAMKGGAALEKLIEFFRAEPR